MASPERDDCGVKLSAAAAATAAGALLTGLVLTGCASGSPTGQTGAGGSAPSTSASASSSPASGRPMSSAPPSSPNDPASTATPVAGGGPSGPGCAAWPAGSTTTTLLITQASNGQRYCVRTGETVQVSSAGKLSLMAGSKPPRLIGTSLVPAPARPGGAIQSPAATYSAVRPGVARLIVVRLPCRSAQTPRTPNASPMAGEMAYVTSAGGAPVGAQCQLVQALQVTIVVS
jgi:hypothetical protein